MKYTLYQNLETTVRFMYQKDKALNFDSFNKLISKIQTDCLSDLPDLQKKREDLYKDYFRENNIPEVMVNGLLVTDFEQLSKITSILPNSTPEFSSPKPDTKKKDFSMFEEDDKKDIFDSVITLSDSLKSITVEAFRRRKDPSSTLSGINFIYYPEIKQTIRDFYLSFNKVSAFYTDKRFAVPRLFEANGISNYRDLNGNILDFDSIIANSKEKCSSFPNRD